MVSTISSAGQEHQLESLVQAVRALISGNLKVADVQGRISLVLEEFPDIGEDLQEFLDAELQAARLSIGDYGELATAVGAVLSEDVPTEWSEEAPNEPGIYRVVDEGTLVLANDDVPFDPKQAKARPEPANDAAASEEQVAPIAVGSILRDRYRLDQEVARGSMGIIYKASDLLKLEAGANAPYIAVKVFNPEMVSNRDALRSFQNEVANAQHLSHQNIIHLFELDRDEGHFFITMEWLDGESLDALLDRSKGSALEPVQAYAIIDQLCDALSYAHEHDVVHADVKPGNVFLTEAGELKLIDFGIARANVPAAKLLRNDAVALTPAYASCERLEKKEPTAQDDLYSLACMIYRLLAGRRVFGAITALEAENLQMEPVPIGDLTAERWAALRKALSFRKGDRQATVREFADEFGFRRLPRGEESIDDSQHTNTMTIPVLPEPIYLGDGADFEGSADSGVDFLFEEGDAAPVANDADSTSELFADAGDVEQETPAAPPVDEPTIEQPAAAAVYDEPTMEQPRSSDSQQSVPVLAWFQNKGLAGGAVAVVVAAVVIWLLTDAPEAPQTVTTAVDERVPSYETVIEEPEQLQEIVVEAYRLPVIVDSPVATDATVAASDTTPEAAVTLPVVESQPSNEVVEVATTTSAEPQLPVVNETPVAAPVAEAAVVTTAVVTTPTLPETAAEPAAETESVSPEAAAAAIISQRMGTLNRRANEAIAAGRLLEPADDSAAYWTEQMRAEDPESPLVATVTVALAAVALTQANSAIVSRDPALAEEFAGLAEANSAPEETLATLRNDISNLREQMELEAIAAAAAAEEAARLAAFDPEAPIALSELEFTNYVEPRAPRRMANRRYNGWVDVSFRVNEDGKTSNIQIIDSDLPASFERPAVSAVSDWTFESYVRDGEIVSVNTAVRLRFEN